MTFPVGSVFRHFALDLESDGRYDKAGTAALCSTLILLDRGSKLFHRKFLSAVHVFKNVDEPFQSRRLVFARGRHFPTTVCRVIYDGKLRQLVLCPDSKLVRPKGIVYA